MVESDEDIMSSKEDLKQNTSDKKTTKHQLLKTFIDKGYSIYKIDKKVNRFRFEVKSIFSKRKQNENWNFFKETRLRKE